MTKSANNSFIGMFLILHCPDFYRTGVVTAANGNWIMIEFDRLPDQPQPPSELFTVEEVTGRIDLFKTRAAMNEWIEYMDAPLAKPVSKDDDNVVYVDFHKKTMLN